MKWFKHFTDWHRDPDVCDGYTFFSHLSYVFFQCLREAYSEFYDLRDDYGFIRLSLVNISRRCHARPGKILRLFSFFQERNRISYRIEDTFVFFQVHEFDKLVGHWRQRRENTEGAPLVHGHGDEEKKKEEEKREDVKKEEKKGEDTVESVSREIMEYFNKKTGKCLNDHGLIAALLKEGRQKEDFFRIIDLKAADPFFQKNRKLYNLRTLFAGDRFDTYLAEYHDSRQDSPAAGSAAPATELNFWAVKSAYFHFLKKEHAPMQDNMRDLIARNAELSGYVTRHGLDTALDAAAVHSRTPEKIVLFPQVGFNGHMTQFLEFFTSVTGIGVETLWEVPESFIASESFKRYYKTLSIQKEIA